MGATNKTVNLQLPIFSDTDKPTWLGDVNDTNYKIDTAVAGVVTKAEAAGNSAATAMKLATDASTAAEKNATDLSTETKARTDADTAMDNSLKQNTASITTLRTDLDTTTQTANAAGAKAAEAKDSADKATSLVNAVSDTANQAMTKATKNATDIVTLQGLKVKTGLITMALATGQTAGDSDVSFPSAFPNSSVKVFVQSANAQDGIFATRVPLDKVTATGFHVTAQRIDGQMALSTRYIQLFYIAVMTQG